MIGELSAAEATIIVAAIGAVPATIAAVRANTAARQAGAANRAVNDVGPDEPPLRRVIQGIDDAQTEQSARLARIESRLDDGGKRMDSLEAGVRGLNSSHRRHLAWHQTETEQGPRVAGSLDLDDDGGQT